jgi:hypothetical protein
MKSNNHDIKSDIQCDISLFTSPRYPPNIRINLFDDVGKVSFFKWEAFVKTFEL